MEAGIGRDSRARLDAQHESPTRRCRAAPDFFRTYRRFNGDKLTKVALSKIQVIVLMQANSENLYASGVLIEPAAKADQRAHAQ